MSFKTAAEKRLSQLRSKNTAHLLAIAFQESSEFRKPAIVLPTNTKPASRKNQPIKKADTAPIETAAILETTSEAEIIAQPEPIPEPVKEFENKPAEVAAEKPKIVDNQKYIWWLDYQQCKVALEVKIPESFLNNLRRFRKAQEGGWLINGTNLGQRQGPKNCNGIVVSSEEKALLEEAKVPGVFKLYK